MGPAPSLMRDLKFFRGQLARALGPVDVVLLFGSQARGDSGRDSDVDVLVVSQAFEGRNHFDRASQLRRLWELPYPVDFLCYTPEEFEHRRSQVGIVRVALEEGVAVES